MKRPPPRGHKDAIHDEVAQVFQGRGWSTLDLSALGQGAPDLLVAKGAIGCLVEIKSRASKAKRYQPTAEQERFAQLWRGWSENVAGLGEAALLAEQLEGVYRRTAAVIEAVR